MLQIERTVATAGRVHTATVMAVVALAGPQRLSLDCQPQVAVVVAAAVTILAMRTRAGAIQR